MPVRHNKQVRFAYKNTFHSPPVTPFMPVLTFSSSTTPSSLGPITPPSSMPFPLPGVTSSVGSYTSSSRATHGSTKVPTSAMVYAGATHPHHYFEESAINWDLMDHPSAITRNHQPISSRVWTEAATNPPLPFMVITISNFCWKFNVSASNHCYVTVEDVINTVYRSLRKNITQADFQAAGSPRDQRKASRAYELRYRRQRSTRLYEEEKMGGMKRVDFLMTHTRFIGLSSHGRHPDEWRLHVT